MHVYISLSAHGRGHAAQAGVVVEALRRRLPDVELTICSALDRATLESFIAPPFAHLAAASDIGLVMRSVLEVDVAESHARYRDWHADLPRHIAEEAERMSTARPDVALSDASYTAIAAAARTGCPAIGLCSMNWADVYGAYCRNMPGAAGIEAEIRACLLQADAYLLTSPAPAMPWHPRARFVPPLAKRGRADRAALAAACGAGRDDLLVMAAVGGYRMSGVSGREIRESDGAHIITQGLELPSGAHVTPMDALPWRAIDVVASADIVLTKYGYNLVVEAASHGRPLLLLPRPGWVETAPIREWLTRNWVFEELPVDRLQELPARARALTGQPRPRPPLASGGEVVAQALMAAAQPPASA